MEGVRLDRMRLMWSLKPTAAIRRLIIYPQGSCRRMCERLKQAVLFPKGPDSLSSKLCAKSFWRVTNETSLQRQKGLRARRLPLPTCRWIDKSRRQSAEWGVGRKFLASDALLFRALHKAHPRS